MGKIMILFVVFLLLINSGCASTSVFPTNGSQTLTSASEFGVLTAQPDAFQGRAIKLAGRMVGVETTDEGTMVTAEWLPYPHNEYDGPVENERAPHRRFALFYPGKLDAQGILRGNKFIVVGKMEETPSTMSFAGTSQGVPHITARCLHVWKTGNDKLETEPDIEYPAVMQETYCSDT